MKPAMLSIASLALLPLSVHARGIESLQPQTLPLQSGEVADTTPAPAAEGRDFQGPPLAGLRLTTPEDKTPPAEGIAVSGLPEVDSAALSRVLGGFLGQPLSQSTLTAVTRAIVQYYQRHTGLMVDVIAPAGQDITEGRVRFVVVKARLGKLSATGQEHFTEEDITSAFTTAEGDTVNTLTMLKDLDWANRNPFRRTNLLYRRGAEEGETDVVLQTADRRPWRTYAGANDTGTDLTGNARLFAGFNLGNVWGEGHQFNYQFTASDDLKKMRGHAASYVALLPWRHILTLSASHQQVNPDVAAPMKSDGFAYELGADYTVPLLVAPGAVHDVTFGYDFKRSNNNLEFGGVQVFNTAVDVSQFSAGYRLRAEDRHGDTDFMWNFVASPGGATDKNTDRAHNVARAGATAQYAYTVLDLERTTLLPGGFTWLTEAGLQLASKRLPGSEQMTIGGHGTVRGYSEGETSGDSGFTLRNELRAPGLPLWGDDALTALAFVDYGTVDRNTLQAGETARDTQLSVGPGVRYRLGTHLNVRAEYGLQLRNEQGDRGQRAHVGMTLSY